MVNDREELFCSIFKEKHEQLLGYVISEIWNPIDAEDVLQEVGKSFWEYLGNHRGEAKPETVLFVIMRRRIADYLRKKYKRKKIFDYLYRYHHGDFSISDEQAIERYTDKRLFKINLFLHPAFDKYLDDNQESLLLAMRRTIQSGRCK